MPRIAFIPLDTLFFRDGKPFEIGEDNWAEGQFFPAPSVFYGAIKSAYFAANRQNIALIGGAGDPTADLEITGLHIMNNGIEYIPCPLDYVKYRDDDEDYVFPTGFIAKNNVTLYSNYCYNFIPYNETEVETVANAFISKDGLDRYRIDKGKIKYYTRDKFGQTEAKIGLALDNSTHSSASGKLFRVGLTRFKQLYNQEDKQIEEIYFSITYINLAQIESSVVKLGAEGKAARVKHVEPYIEKPFPEDAKQSKYFKLLLTTPAIFENGMEPDLQALLGEVKVSLLTAFTGKPQAIGGWDIINKKPKAMYRAVPAGAVYYFKIESNHSLGHVDEAMRHIHSVSSYKEHQKMGFGLFVLANLNLSK